MRLAAMTTAGCAMALKIYARSVDGRRMRLFDGKTLKGWLQIENDATSLSSGQITNQAGFVDQLANGVDGVSVFLRGQVDEAVRGSLGRYAVSDPAAKATLSMLVKNLNQIVAGPSIFTKARFAGITLRPETRKLIKYNPHGQWLARLNKLLIEDAYAAEIAQSATAGWEVRDRAMASKGTGRGVIYTEKDFSRFRLTFTMRHISGKPDHQACVLIFCTRPQGDEKPLDALGGIQFQVPNGGHWDYRPGMNSAGGQEFHQVMKTTFDVHAWSSAEILADATKGTARMAVAQPPGSKAIEVLDFKDPAAGKAGPVAWQMHNAGLFDEYKDVIIELDPPQDELLTIA
ncbi:MAG: family 16 glycoside hydrolase [Terracidiphilus sp.]